jgi:hypothetical protein
LIRYRVLVEIEYFIALCELPLPQLKGVDVKLFDKLRDIYKISLRPTRKPSRISRKPQTTTSKPLNISSKPRLTT